MALLLEIVTPEKKVYSGEVDSVTLPTQTGELCILPGHIPLLTMIEPGELRVQKGGVIDLLAVDRGFIEIHGDKISVLTEQAIDIAEVDEEAIEDAVNRARKALEDAREQCDDAEILKELETAARFTVVQQLIHQKKHSH
jgi:F-type H+-transporting ATPase subunit epsilon